MTLNVQTVAPNNLVDLARLFATDPVAEDCWCMWFIIPVKEFHAIGRAGNRARFAELLAASDLPMGLLAYRAGEPVGWCAVGPRSRFARAVKTPTYRDAASDGGEVWLVPCFFVRRDAQGGGVSRALLEAAVALAAEHGATAIDGFPFAGAKRRSGGDVQVGFEPLFAACGFTVISSPSPSRVVMRRVLRS